MTVLLIYVLILMSFVLSFKPNLIPRDNNLDGIVDIDNAKKLTDDLVHLVLINNTKNYRLRKYNN